MEDLFGLSTPQLPVTRLSVLTALMYFLLLLLQGTEIESRGETRKNTEPAKHMQLNSAHASSFSFSHTHTTQTPHTHTHQSHPPRCRVASQTVEEGPGVSQVNLHCPQEPLWP